MFSFPGSMAGGDSRTPPLTLSFFLASGCYNRVILGTTGASFMQNRFAQALRALIGVAIFGMAILGSLVGAVAANAKEVSRPAVPDAIQAPSGEAIVLLAHAAGSQIYTCQNGADGKFAWTLKAPDAELKDEGGKVIGTHFAGPTWKLKDGSEVMGKATAHVDSDDPGSIAWLLVNATGHSGSGMLAAVTTIQRVHTHGGKAPAQGCDESHRNAETKSSYTADYYFYAPRK
jgi:uncharacterized protein DUF3455